MFEIKIILCSRKKNSYLHLSKFPSALLIVQSGIASGLTNDIICDVLRENDDTKNSALFLPFICSGKKYYRSCERTIYRSLERLKKIDLFLPFFLSGIFLPIQRAVFFTVLLERYFLPIQGAVFFYRSKERYFFTDSGLKLE